MLPFQDREDAGRRLGAVMGHYRGRHPLVLAIPRGGVPLGRIVADLLDGELDVVLVRKLGAPRDPEFAIGAVDEAGTVTLNEHAAWIGADTDYVRHEACRQHALLRERRQRYGAGRGAASAEGRIAIVVDDGLATGATMLVALRVVRAQRPARLVCAVPVAARDSLDAVGRVADEVVCLAAPWPFPAVGEHYRGFARVDDAQVAAALSAPRPGEGDPAPAPRADAPGAAARQAVTIAVDGAQVAGKRHVQNVSRHIRAYQATRPERLATHARVSSDTL